MFNKPHMYDKVFIWCASIAKKLCLHHINNAAIVHIMQLDFLAWILLFSHMLNNFHYIIKEATMHIHRKKYSICGFPSCKTVIKSHDTQVMPITWNQSQYMSSFYACFELKLVLRKIIIKVCTPTSKCPLTPFHTTTTYLDSDVKAQSQSPSNPMNVISTGPKHFRSTSMKSDMAYSFWRKSFGTKLVSLTLFSEPNPLPPAEFP